jgi:hypothetical protein
MKTDVTAKLTKLFEFHLENNDTINITDLLMRMSWLKLPHLQEWRNSDKPLDTFIQCGQKKWQEASFWFEKEVEALDSVEVPWMSYSLIIKNKKLAISIQENPKIEKLFSRHYFKKGITARKKTSIITKLTQKPDTRLFINNSKDGKCTKCKQALNKDEIIYTEANDTYCLKCVNLDSLAFLPSGNATLSRRARKNTRDFAEVVEFNKRRIRYERRGILVEQTAIDAAQMECDNDAGKRAVSREKSAVKRVEEDFDFTAKFLSKIVEYFPKCPLDEIEAIAKHATERSSGRVGRTAAAKKFDEEMIRLAVIAYIRHQHTDYDRLLLNRTPKQMARKLIQKPLQKKLISWE